jgi:hypothetical protein
VPTFGATSAGRDLILNFVILPAYCNTVVGLRFLAGRSQSPSLDDLERSLQSVQLLLDAQQLASKQAPAAAPANETPVRHMMNTDLITAVLDTDLLRQIV